MEWIELLAFLKAIETLIGLVCGGGLLLLVAAAIALQAREDMR